MLHPFTAQKLAETDYDNTALRLKALLQKYDGAFAPFYRAATNPLVIQRVIIILAIPKENLCV
ncbi:MAG: hypothetical protein A3F73_07390 [Gallionellales bacterium RIFCSPLOWO2_12_FULL_59_22]|nr:MAG: hypothetical protein A3H99_09830 [Gallionellales bacterium RIFCSPLOWO2_02_FULL_59_110]OGT01551.1 MAG: hypothetical protein A2Z65_02830 [Gallionellales bacterium RIFCSPLOWO2_02_58_13]OGT13160.1 MAG: hypothetical protein A3F73_07390 [Gallionellales bacterium RIFCSPLOWO2_12_FULL_59_22]